MSEKYIPPSRRGKTDKPLVVSPDNFPQLSARQHISSNAQLSKPFSALATEWNEKDEHENEQKQFQKELESRNRERDEAIMRSVVHHRTDKYESEEWVEPQQLAISRTDPDGWQTVERKAKRELTLEEKDEKRQKFLEAEEKRKLEDDSVWNTNARNAEEWTYRERT